MTARRTPVAVVGAAGYAGGELLRLLLGHPRVEVVAAASSRLAGRRVDGAHPNLRGLTDLSFVSPDGMADAEVVFLAVGADEAVKAVAARPAGRGVPLIDLSPAFRLRDPRVFEGYYGVPHGAPELLGDFVPGLPETHRAALRTADRISVPGCMATAAILALLPLAGAAADGDVSVDGRIGSSGSGASADRFNLHAERSGAMRVFAPHSHRHEAEVSQATGLTVRMGATGVEAVRGLQVVCRLRSRRPVGEVDVRRLYREAYEDEPFVRIVAQRRGLYRLPEPKILTGSNFCDVGFAVRPDGRGIVAVAAMDNLVKGAAGNAVQCMNVRMGWPEPLGLGFPGLHPI